jgi:Protein kinase domain
MFKIKQYSRNDTDVKHKEMFSDLSDLISANIARDNEGADLSEYSHSILERSKRSSVFSIFSVEFPVKSTFAVLSFIECRLPGIAFLTYKREEGIPELDSIVFGRSGNFVCDHPLAMKIKDNGMDPSSSIPLASCLIGYDLRLVKELSARPSTRDDCDYSFELSGSALEKVASWWNMRNPLQSRIRSFLGVDPSTEFSEIPGYEMKKMSPPSNGIDTNYMEGEKVISSDLQGILSTTKANLQRVSHQPDLKDISMLQKCRAVVVDLGNACWTHRHFSEDIQTRQYRSPEVLIGAEYDTSADMWSLACVTFELLTGDLLFDPRAGEDYDRDEDHLAMFQELLGKMPKRLSLSGKYSKKFFDRKGSLKHIKQLKFWPVQDVLHEKYHFSKEDADAVAAFMKPLLDFDPKQRGTALEAIRSDWLKNVN